MYEKKIKQGYVLQITEQPEDLGELIKSGRSRVFVEKMHNWDKDKEKLIKQFPLLIQRKYNGTLMCMVYHPAFISETNTIGVDCYLRGRVTFHQNELIANEAVNELGLIKYPGLHLVGELYMHGKYLEDISGLARAETAASDIYSELEYWIFDCFIIGKKNWTFKERYEFLTQLFGNKEYKFVN